MTLRDYLHRLGGLQLRDYTSLDCKAAVAIWCPHLSRAERDSLAEFLFTRCRRGRITLAAALARR